MDLNTIKTLIESMAASDLQEMVFQQDNWTLKLTRALPAAPIPSQGGAVADPVATPSQRPAKDDPVLVSPLYGIVHLQPSPDAPPFVVVGQAVDIGTPICMVEAMKVFNQVCSDRAGTIESILILSGDEVEAGQILMRIC